jgi:hypothetical protein
MATKTHAPIDISVELIDAIRSLPIVRKIEHCGAEIKVSPFDFYADCPSCGSRIKVRAFSGVPEIEDIFDAVFEWLNDPRAQQLADRRRIELAEDPDE